MCWCSNLAQSGRLCTSLCFHVSVPYVGCFSAPAVSCCCRGGWSVAVVLRWALAGALRSPSDLVHAPFVHCPPCSTYCTSAVCTLYSCQQKDCCSSCHQCVPRHQHRHRLFMSSPGLAQAGVAGYRVVGYRFGFYCGVESSFNPSVCCGDVWIQAVSVCSLPSGLASLSLVVRLP